MKNNPLVPLILPAILCLLFAGCSKSNSPISSGGDSSSNAAASVGTGKPVEMKIKWIVGKRYGQQMELVQDGHHEAPGGETAIDQTMTMTQDFNIDVLKGLADGGTELRLEFTGQRMASTLNGKPSLNFDSKTDAREDDKNPAAPLLRKMIGAHFMYDLDADGKVDKVIGLDDFYDQISGANPQSKAAIKNMMNEDMLKQMAMRGLGLPEKPVKIGEQWPVRMDVSAGAVGTLKLNLQYTFKAWDMHDGKKCALLVYAGDMSTAPAGTNKSAISIDGGKIEGQTWFDPALGMVIDTSSKQTLTLKSAVKGKGMNSKMSQTVDTKVTQVSDLPK